MPISIGFMISIILESASFYPRHAYQLAGRGVFPQARAKDGRWPCRQGPVQPGGSISTMSSGYETREDEQTAMNAPSELDGRLLFLDPARRPARGVGAPASRPVRAPIADGPAVVAT